MQEAIIWDEHYAITKETEMMNCLDNLALDDMRELNTAFWQIDDMLNNNAAVSEEIDSKTRDFMRETAIKRLENENLQLQFGNTYMVQQLYMQQQLQRQFFI